MESTVTSLSLNGTVGQWNVSDIHVNFTGEAGMPTTPITMDTPTTAQPTTSVLQASEYPLTFDNIKSKSVPHTKQVDNLNSDQSRMLQNSLMMLLSMMHQSDDKLNSSVPVSELYLPRTVDINGRYIFVSTLAVGVVAFLLLLACLQRTNRKRRNYENFRSDRAVVSRKRKFGRTYQSVKQDTPTVNYDDTFVGVSVPLLQDVTTI